MKIENERSGGKKKNRKNEKENKEEKWESRKEGRKEGRKAWRKKTEGTMEGGRITDNSIKEVENQNVLRGWGRFDKEINN